MYEKIKNLKDKIIKKYQENEEIAWYLLFGIVIMIPILYLILSFK